jgi:hypothetical protein
MRLNIFPYIELNELDEPDELNEPNELSVLIEQDELGLVELDELHAVFYHAISWPGRYWQDTSCEVFYLIVISPSVYFGFPPNCPSEFSCYKLPHI